MVEEETDRMQRLKNVYRKLQEMKITNKYVFLLVSILMVMQIEGYRISEKYQTTFVFPKCFDIFKNIRSWQIGSLLVIEFLVLNVLFCRLFSYLEEHKEENNGKSIQLRWWIIPAFMLIWFPTLLAFYPGISNYDTPKQYLQAVEKSIPYSTHHPLLHTLIFGGAMKIGQMLPNGDLQKGLLIYTLSQCLICAIMFYMIMKFINSKKWLVIATFCYFALFPVISLFAISMTKDVLFSLALALCILQLYEMYSDKESFWDKPSKPVKLIITTVVMCLLRNNGIYAVFLFAICSILLKGISRKKNLLLFGIIFALYLLISNGLMLALHAEKGNKREAFHVPMQQLARVYCEHGEDAFDEEQLELLYRAIPGDAIVAYSPVFADEIKERTNFYVVLDNKADYLKLWIDIGLKYPREYVDAFLENTYQFWYPWTTVVDDVKTGHRYYFDFQMRGGEIVRESHFYKLLLVYYEFLDQAALYQKIPFVRLLFSMGTMLWISLCALFYGLYTKNCGIIWAEIMVLCYCATAMLGPVSLVRYYLILFYIFPVNLYFLFGGRVYCKKN